MKKSIILVGNGSTLLDSKKGACIDLFDTVVRFNSFKLCKYKAHVGYKTDIWFTVNIFHKNSIDEFKKVIVHSWEMNKEKCNVFESLNNLRECEKISRSLIKSIDINTPSTGLIAIHYFLQEYDKVHITGFDWWKTEKHHYGDEEIRGTLHNPKKEYEIIKKLINQGKVVLI